MARTKGEVIEKDVKGELEERVETLASYHVSEADISLITGLGAEKLGEYREAMERGRAKSYATLAQRLYQKALSGDSAALIFLAKTKLGWTEAAQRVDITNSDNSMRPVMTQALLTGQELTRLEGVCENIKWDKEGVQ
jgi:hypothetical protein